MKRQWQKIKSKRKREYNVAQHTGQVQANHKAKTVPDSQCSPHSIPTASTSMSPSTEPKKLNRPLPVTPYQRHVNEKRKPAESLRQSGIIPDTADRNKTDSLSDLPVDVSSNLTPPDTPRSAVSADQSSPDQMSLDGKEPGYENITFRKVASGNSEGNSTKNAKADKKDSRDPDTESISTISTCSSTDEEGNWWEKQDNDKPPPPPPPRTGLHSPFPSESTSVDDPVQISGVTGRSSPFDDFSSSIAQALFDNSKRRSDPFAASALANMSQDIRADSTQNGHRTKVQKTLSNPTSSRRPPPPKPPPYSGRGVALFYHEIEATKMGF